MPLAEFTDRYGTLISHLMKAVHAERVGHSYLIYGDNIETLKRFSKAWMQVNTCTEISSTSSDACGACKNCQAIETDTYEYLKIVKPQSKSRQITVDQIYELEHFLHLTSDGQKKIACIWDADRMNMQTQNAFLKTLEEPTNNTLILMVTVSPGAMLATIRSRCQRIALLDNYIAYPLGNPEEFFQTISKMKKGEGMTVAATMSQYLINHLDTLKKSIDDEAKERSKDMKAQAREMSVELSKQEKDEEIAMIESEYRAKREMLLSAIHTWFSMEYMRANGIGKELLPNPEIYDYTGFETAPGEMDARYQLQKVDDFLDSLNYNVDEKLAIENFCQDLCIKG
ncbi:MAG: hypothetical protein HRT89_04100 [Lentisphaeria bacterium]|nr:hypothetical protein [Lentisphaeria bacterium]NQZ67233.1 hypothetical protein [Lentisphaeria bacterium]